MPYKDPEKARECKRRSAALHREEQNERKRIRRRERYATEPEYRAKVLARYAGIPMEARRAHWAVKNEIRRGRLVRPEVCARCDAKGFIEAAHRDYSKPLEIEWLCRSCHRRDDRAQRKIAQ